MADATRPCDARGVSDEPAPEHRRPDGVTDDTVEALGKLSAALDHIEDARGHLYAFHRLMGSAESTMEEATAMVRDAGHADIADALDRDVLGRNPLPGMWSFQMVEAFDDGFYAEREGHPAARPRRAGRRATPRLRGRDEGAAPHPRDARATRRPRTTPTAPSDRPGGRRSADRHARPTPYDDQAGGDSASDRTEEGPFPRAPGRPGSTPHSTLP